MTESDEHIFVDGQPCCQKCQVGKLNPKAQRSCMGGTEKEVELARLMVVSYLLGWKEASGKSSPIPETASALMSKGHDGLNWQKFLPVAKDFLKQEKEV